MIDKGLSMGYDIFISYRHDYSTDKAGHLYTLLKNMGYQEGQISFDMQNLNHRYALNLMQRVDNCNDFIIVLSEKTFSDLVEEDTEKYVRLATCALDNFESLQKEILPKPNYTRLELARALAQKKNVIPIFPDTNEAYDFYNSSLPVDIQDVKAHQGLKYNAGVILFEKQITSELPKLLDSKPQEQVLLPLAKSNFQRRYIYIICLLVVMCIGNLCVWRDYQFYKKCQSINDYSIYIEEGQGIFNRHAQKQVKAINELLEFSNCTDEIKSLVKGKDYSHLTRLQAEALNEILANMVYVHGGKFLMGTDDERASRKEKPCHEVVVDDFFIGKFEVSRYEWNAIKGVSLSATSRDSLDIPITNIPWEEVCRWIEELNVISDLNFTLPHEKEWEYAARGGIWSNKNTTYAGGNNLSEVAWSLQDSLNAPRPRLRDGVTWYRKSNELRLHNMSGNVSEMCSNEFYYYDSSKSFLGIDKVTRGGSYDSPITHCTVTSRDLLSAIVTSPSIGFRLILKNNSITS